MKSEAKREWEAASQSAGKNKTAIDHLAMLLARMHLRKLNENAKEVSRKVS